MWDQAGGAFGSAAVPPAFGLLPLCRCAERTADLILRPGWSAVRQTPPAAERARHFAFGEGLGAALGPVTPQTDVLKLIWSEYGNRVGRGGQTLWSIPYPQELNDIPMVIARQMDACDFAQMVIDQFDEMLEQAHRPARAQALVMGIALHPCIMGQPYRIRHLRRALRHIEAHRADIWLTTPGAIYSAMDALAPGMP